MPEVIIGTNPDAATWVVIMAGGVMQCQRCGTINRVRMPVSLMEFLKQSDAFIARHSQCLPPTQ